MVTVQQQQARLSPEAFTINVPTTGLFRGKGSLGTLYKREGDKITSIDIVALLIPDNAERVSIGNFGAQVKVAEQRLKERFNIDLQSLSEVNIGDLRQSRASAVAGQKIAPRLSSVQGNFTGANSLTDINQFLGVSQAQIQQAQQNTQQIHDMIERLQDGAKKAVSAMKHSIDGSRNSVESSQTTKHHLDTVVGHVSIINDMNTQIVSAAEEQSLVSEQINKSIEQISDIIERSAEDIHTTTAAGEKLALHGKRLRELVEQFKY